MKIRDILAVHRETLTHLSFWCSPKDKSDFMHMIPVEGSRGVQIKALVYGRCYIPAIRRAGEPANIRFGIASAHVCQEEYSGDAHSDDRFSYVSSTRKGAPCAGGISREH